MKFSPFPVYHVACGLGVIWGSLSGRLPRSDLTRGQLLTFFLSLKKYDSWKVFLRFLALYKSWCDGGGSNGSGAVGGGTSIHGHSHHTEPFCSE